jgi:hypothetical protein
MDEQSVVERAYAFLEDIFGLEHESQAPPTAPENPDAYTFQTIAEVSVEWRRSDHGER